MTGNAREGPAQRPDDIAGPVLGLSRAEVAELVSRLEQGADIDSDSQQLLLRYFSAHTTDPEDIALSRRFDTALRSAVTPSV